MFLTIKVPTASQSNGYDLEYSSIEDFLIASNCLFTCIPPRSTNDKFAAWIDVILCILVKVHVRDYRPVNEIKNTCEVNRFTRLVRSRNCQVNQTEL